MDIVSVIAVCGLGGVSEWEWECVLVCEYKKEGEAGGRRTVSRPARRMLSVSSRITFRSSKLES